MGGCPTPWRMSGLCPLDAISTAPCPRALTWLWQPKCLRVSPQVEWLVNNRCFSLAAPEAGGDPLPGGGLPASRGVCTRRRETSSSLWGLFCKGPNPIPKAALPDAVTSGVRFPGTWPPEPHQLVAHRQSRGRGGAKRLHPWSLAAPGLIASASLAAPGALQVQRGEDGGAMKPMSFEPFRAPGPSQPHLPSRVLIAGHSGAPGGPWEGADADVPGEVGVLAARTLTGGIHEASKCHLCGREKCARPSWP